MVLDNLSTGSSSTPKQVKLITANAADGPAVRRTIAEFGVDCIAHVAALSDIAKSKNDPLVYYRNNMACSLEVIEAAVQSGVKHIIFASSAAVYGSPNSLPVTEESATLPLSAYGHSKLMTETMLHDAWSAFGLAYVILRQFNVVGADPQLRTGPSVKSHMNLVRAAVRAALGVRSSVEIYGTTYPTADGTCVRDFVHVADVANAYVLSLKYLRQGGAPVTLNCSSGRGVSVLDVVSSVKQISGKEFPVDLKPERPGDAPIVIGACSLASEVIAWNPYRSDFSNIVSHQLAWESSRLDR